MQGALKSKKKLLITVFDPSLQSLKVSSIRANETTFGNLETTVNYTSDFPKDNNFDLCIISTSSDVRASVTTNLLNRCKVRFIIFEKILFQKEIDFEIISELLKKNRVKAWVNCPRRTLLT